MSVQIKTSCSIFCYNVTSMCLLKITVILLYDIKLCTLTEVVHLLLSLPVVNDLPSGSK